MNALLSILAVLSVNHPSMAATTLEVRCVPRCLERFSDGSCRRFAEDYCAPNAYCVERCTERWSDGSCRVYGADYCGSEPERCNNVGPKIASRTQAK